MGSNIFIEVGPKPTLLAMGKECLAPAGDSIKWLANLLDKESKTAWRLQVYNRASGVWTLSATAAIERSEAEHTHEIRTDVLCGE